MSNAWNDGSTDYFCGCEQPDDWPHFFIGLLFDVSLHGGNEQQQRSFSFRDVMRFFMHIISSVLSDLLGVDRWKPEASLFGCQLEDWKRSFELRSFNMLD